MPKCGGDGKGAVVRGWNQNTIVWEWVGVVVGMQVCVLEEVDVRVCGVVQVEVGVEVGVEVHVQVPTGVGEGVATTKVDAGVSEGSQHGWWRRERSGMGRGPACVAGLGRCSAPSTANTNPHGQHRRSLPDTQIPIFQPPH